MMSVNLASFAIFAIVALCTVNNISGDSDGTHWENVFSDTRSQILPLRHWENKTYYMGIHTQLTWHEAVNFCKNIHMKLVAIRSAQEHEQILKYIRQASLGYEYWTGGSRLLDGQTWVWFPYGDEIDYTNWGSGQPSGGEPCLQVWWQDNTLKWNDRPCDVRFRFVCERYDDEYKGQVL